MKHLMWLAALPYRVEPSSTLGAQMTAASAVLERFNADGAAQPGCVVRK